MKVQRRQCKEFGYKEVVEYLDGNIKKEEMIEKIKQETRRYAKRQFTWFKKYEKIIWISADEEIEENVQYIIKKGLKG